MSPSMAIPVETGMAISFCAKIEEREGEAMTIQIQKPELEALILDRMHRGAFENVEDVLMHALKSSSLQSDSNGAAPSDASARTGADLVEAMQASPYKEISLETARDRLPVRDVAL